MPTYLSWLDGMTKKCHHDPRAGGCSTFALKQQELKNRKAQ